MRHGYVQYIPTRAPSLNSLLGSTEAQMIGALARQVHEHGEAFQGWPLITRTWLTRDEHGVEHPVAEGDPGAYVVRLEADILGLPR